MTNPIPGLLLAGTILFPGFTAAALPDPGMTIAPGCTALVVTDPQNDFLSPKGVTWGVVGKSVTENNTAEHIGGPAGDASTSRRRSASGVLRQPGLGLPRNSRGIRKYDTYPDRLAVSPPATTGWLSNTGTISGK